MYFTIIGRGSGSIDITPTFVKISDASKKISLSGTHTPNFNYSNGNIFYNFTVDSDYNSIYFDLTGTYSYNVDWYLFYVYDNSTYQYLSSYTGDFSIFTPARGNYLLKANRYSSYDFSFDITTKTRNVIQLDAGVDKLYAFEYPEDGAIFSIDVPSGVSILKLVKSAGVAYIGTNLTQLGFDTFPSVADHIYYPAAGTYYVLLIGDSQSTFTIQVDYNYEKLYYPSIGSTYYYTADFDKDLISLEFSASNYDILMISLHATNSLSSTERFRMYLVNAYTFSIDLYYSYVSYDSGEDKQLVLYENTGSDFVLSIVADLDDAISHQFSITIETWTYDDNGVEPITTTTTRSATTPSTTTSTTSSSSDGDNIQVTKRTGAAIYDILSYSIGLEVFLVSNSVFVMLIRLRRRKQN